MNARTSSKIITKWNRNQEIEKKERVKRDTKEWVTACVWCLFKKKKKQEEKGKVEQIFERCGSLSNLGITNLIVVPMWIECKTNKSNLADRWTNKTTTTTMHPPLQLSEYHIQQKKKKKKKSSRTNISKVAFQSDSNSNQAYDEI